MSSAIVSKETEKYVKRGLGHRQMSQKCTSEPRPWRKIEREAPNSSNKLITESLPRRSASDRGVSCFF
jgi:hypothetical protein